MRISNLRRHILNFLKMLAAQMTLEKVLKYIAYLFRSALEMKCVDIPEPIQITDIPIDSLVGVSDFGSIDKGIFRGKVYQGSKAPDFGRYKLIAFHNGPGGISVRSIRVVVWLFSWKLATMSEVISVGQGCRFKEIGLDQSCSIASFGTVIKIPTAVSSWFNLYYSPIVWFNETNGRPVKDKNIRLHDLSDNYPSDHYLLVRVG